MTNIKGTKVGDKIRFGCFSFQSGTAVLMKDKEVIKLQNQPTKVLRYLIDNQHRSVSNEELLEKCWSARVSNTALTQAVTKIRHALGDTPDENDKDKTYTLQKAERK